MLLSSWLQSLLGLSRRRRSKRIKTRRSQTDYVRLHVTRLEERIVLSTFNVTTFNDVIDGSDSVTSLREAVIAANSDSNADNDTINLPAGTYTLSLTGTGEDAAATGDLDLTDTTGSLEFHFFQYNDFDLDGSIDDNSVEITGGNTALQVGSLATFGEVIAGNDPDHFQVDIFANLINLLTDGNPLQLSDAGGPLVALADYEFGFQWDFTLAPGGTFLISKDKLLAPKVPEPATLGLFGIGLAGLGFMLRRRRKTAA